MREQAEINKIAWEYRADEYLNARAGGSPAEVAAKMKENPAVRDFHQKYFENVSGKKIANVCGSDGRMAVPLAVRGADVTVFDISEPFKRYALELAKEAGVNIEYVLGDFCETDCVKYGNMFDTIYAEGGILHLFSDINVFMNTIYAITKPCGQLVLNDFHPFRKVSVDYFNTELCERSIPGRWYFPEEERESFPKVMIRLYNLSEIINAVISSGFTLIEFLEHPGSELMGLDDKKIPGEFTIIAKKN